MEKIRDGQMILRVNMDERVQIVDAAMERETTISALIRDAVKFYLGFPPGFIEQMEKAAKEYKMDVSTMIARLMLVYLGNDKAIIDNFHFSKTYERAFRFDQEGKLIDAEKLSDIAYEETDRVCKELLKKMKWIAKGKETLLSREEVALTPALKEMSEAVKGEAKYPAIARAKPVKL